MCSQLTSCLFGFVCLCMIRYAHHQSAVSIRPSRYTLRSGGLERADNCASVDLSRLSKSEIRIPWPRAPTYSQPPVQCLFLKIGQLLREWVCCSRVAAKVARCGTPFRCNRTQNCLTTVWIPPSMHYRSIDRSMHALKCSDWSQWWRSQTTSFRVRFSSDRCSKIEETKIVCDM